LAIGRLPNALSTEVAIGAESVNALFWLHKWGRLAYLMSRRMIVESVEVMPGMMPNGTAKCKVSLGTANAGMVEWLMSPRQAREFARNLNEYARTYGRKTPLPGMQTPGADRSSTDLYPASAARLPWLGYRPIHPALKVAEIANTAQNRF
jgi:hypothetical protein